MTEYEKQIKELSSFKEKLRTQSTTLETRVERNVKKSDELQHKLDATEQQLLNAKKVHLSCVNLT